MLDRNVYHVTHTDFLYLTETMAPSSIYMYLPTDEFCTFDDD